MIGRIRRAPDAKPLAINRPRRRRRPRSRHRAGALWFGAILLAGVASSASGDTLRPGIIGTDDRILLTEDGPPWDAVGQVNRAGFRSAGQCTGTLVAPRIVITAAHCLANAVGGQPFPPSDIHFLAAVRGSDYKGHATARCIRFLDRQGSSLAASPAGPTMSDLAADAAAIVLDGDAGIPPAPLATGRTAEPGMSLTHVAYPGDRRYAPVAHRGCRLLGTSADGLLWFNDCDTHPGSSGGPIFVEEDGTYAIAAIQVAAGSGGANVALSRAAWAELVAAADCD